MRGNNLLREEKADTKDKGVSVSERTEFPLLQGGASIDRNRMEEKIPLSGVEKRQASCEVVL